MHDTFGQALLDALDGRPGTHTIERDDGYRDDMDATQYLTGREAWPQALGDALDELYGRVLDVGCGAGRHALHLQQRGCDVVGMEPSPGAVEACRRRGIRVVTGALGDADLFRNETFDAVVMLGNNLALLESPEAAPRHLQWLADRCRRPAVLIGEGLDATRTDDPGHLAYHARAIVEGRRPGQLRLRIHYQGAAGEWFPYWMMSPDELREVAAATPWEVEQTTGDAFYVATLRLP